jgi:uncharacterized protein YkwD
MLTDARPDPTRTPRNRRWRTTSRLAVAGALVGLLAGCIPLNSQEQHLLSSVNGLRAQHGRAALHTHDDLVHRARHWAGVLASEGRLRHSDLRTVSISWSKVGENVGRASSVEGLHAAFAGSPTHRSTMLDPAFTHVGMGTARSGDGTIYAVQVYLRG